MLESLVAFRRKPARARAGLVNGANGTRTATYEYDPFGRTIRKTGGVMADLNPFRYSTK